MGRVGILVTITDGLKIIDVQMEHFVINSVVLVTHLHVMAQFWTVVILIRV